MLKEIFRKYKDNLTVKAILLSTFVSIIIMIIGSIVGYQGRELYIHIFFNILYFWSNNGFQLAFGYIGLCLVVPAISFSHKVVEYFYMKKYANTFTSFSALFLFLSVIASLLEPDFASIKNYVMTMTHECGHIMENVMYAVCVLCVMLPLLYVSIFVRSLKEMFKYKSININQYLEKTSK